MDEISKISGEINYNKLFFYYNSGYFTTPICLKKFKGSFNTFKEVRDGDKALQEIEQDEKNLKSSLGEITSGNPKHKRECQLDTIKSVQSLHDSRQKVIDLFNNNAKIRSEASYNLKQNKTTETGLKILTPK